MSNWSLQVQSEGMTELRKGWQEKESTVSPSKMQLCLIETLTQSKLEQSEEEVPGIGTQTDVSSQDLDNLEAEVK